ncbi:hypothetical protein SOM08_09510 [Hydrogenophaga sp. SNF1]|nr:hypothetical protein [Hydrogenophaga sp. SNF1]WQB85544.1 hypothetical protein SOM08_09510 [Hydrogenophaga sp. SNF1]
MHLWGLDAPALEADDPEHAERLAGARCCTWPRPWSRRRHRSPW